jgi:hypothetical protein
VVRVRIPPIFQTSCASFATDTLLYTSQRSLRHPAVRIHSHRSLQHLTARSNIPLLVPSSHRSFHLPTARMHSSRLVSPPHRSLHLPTARLDLSPLASTPHRSYTLPIARFIFPSLACTPHSSSDLPTARIHLPTARLDLSPLVSISNCLLWFIATCSQASPSVCSSHRLFRPLTILPHPTSLTPARFHLHCSFPPPLLVSTSHRSSGPLTACTCVTPLVPIFHRTVTPRTTRTHHSHPALTCRCSFSPPTSPCNPHRRHYPCVPPTASHPLF